MRINGRSKFKKKYSFQKMQHINALKKVFSNIFTYSELQVDIYMRIYEKSLILIFPPETSS